MKCSGCDKEIPQDANYCKHCGIGVENQHRRGSLTYKVVTVPCTKGLANTIEIAAVELTNLVNNHIAGGWEPLGGIAMGESQVFEVPYLLQALVRKQS